MMRLYNEDCYKGIKNIPDKSIDLVYIDPPYKYDGGMGKRAAELGVIKEDTKNSIADLSNGINLDLLNELCRVMKYIHIFIWCNKSQIMDYMNYFANEKGCDYDILVWQKSNPLPLFAKRFLDDCEYCLFFVEKGHSKFCGKDSYANSFKAFVGSINKKDKDLYDHPTIKPLQCVKNHIEKSCMGGGVFLIALWDLEQQGLLVNNLE